MSLDMLEKWQLVPVRIPSLFEQNVLKAVGRTQIEGSYKVYAGKTNWRISWKLYPSSLANKKWGALETPWQMTPIRAAFTCCKACDSVEEDDFALLVSIPASCFFDQQALYDKNLKADIGGFPNRDWKISKQSLSILNIARRTHITQSVFFNLSRDSCMCGRIDIKWVTFMRAGGRYANPNLFRWVVLAYSNWISWKE